MVDKKNVLRLRRGRSVGFGLIAIMGFLIAGFVFEPIASSIPDLAPQVESNRLTIPINELEQGDNVSDILDKIPEEVIDDVIDNPITSTDKIEEQLKDEVINDPIGTILVCPPYCGSDSIKIITTVGKTDSSGKRTETVSSFDLTALALFSRDQELREFENGALDVSIKAFPSNPELRLDGTATFDILINNKSALTLPIQVKASGVPSQPIVCVTTPCNQPDDVGSVRVNFISMSGQQSQNYILQFKDNLNKFQNGDSIIEMVLTDIDFKLDSKIQFGGDKLILFKMDIERDDKNILITNEEGVPVKSLKTDNDITIISSTMFPNTAMPRINNIILREGNVLDEGKIIAQGDPSLFAHQETNGTSVSIEGFPLERNTSYNIRVTGDVIFPSVSSVKWFFDFNTVINTPQSQKDYTFSIIYNNLKNSITSNFPDCNESLPTVTGSGSIVTWGCK